MTLEDAAWEATQSNAGRKTDSLRDQLIIRVSVAVQNSTESRGGDALHRRIFWGVAWADDPGRILEEVL